MSDKTYYGILMIKTLIEKEGIYHFSLQTLIKGIYCDDQNLYFKDENGVRFPTSFNMKIIDGFVKEIIGFVISEEELLIKYPHLSILEARECYFNDMKKNTYFGFYSSNSKKIDIVPFDLKGKLEYSNVNATTDKRELVGFDVGQEAKQNEKKFYDNIISYIDSLLNVDQIHLIKMGIGELKTKYQEILELLENYSEDEEIKAVKIEFKCAIDICESLMNSTEVSYQKKELLYLKRALLEKFSRLNLDKKEKKALIKLPDELDCPLDAREIKAFFDERVIGLEEAKKKMISIIIANKNDWKSRASCLFIGPTGSGKTYLAEVARACLNVPVEIVDVMQLTIPGYEGRNIEDILANLLRKAQGDKEKAENGIIFLNEIDKKGSEKNSDVSGRGVLNEFLTFFDGMDYQVTYNKKIYTFNTSKLTIFAGGSFSFVLEQMKKKSMGFENSLSNSCFETEQLRFFLEKYGEMPADLIGRFTSIVLLPEPTKESLKAILNHPLISPLTIKCNLFLKEGVTLYCKEDCLEAMASKAIKLKAGARDLNHIVEEIVKEAYWEVLTNKMVYTMVTLNKETVDDPTACLLEDRNGTSKSLREWRNSEAKLELKQTYKL